MTQQLGVCAHLWGSSQSDVDKTLNAAQAAKLTMIRWDAPWKCVEVAKGQLAVPAIWDYIVDQATAKGIECLLILDYGNPLYDGGDKPKSAAAIAAFADYAGFLAGYFLGRVRHFEIWNEWNEANGGTSYGQPEDYAVLVRATYPAIKARSPNSVVLVGSFSRVGYYGLINYQNQNDDFERFLKEDIANYCDAIAVHPYVSVRETWVKTILAVKAFLKAIHDAIRATPGLENKPIYITEVGWTTAETTEALQKDYLWETLKQIALFAGYTNVLIYEIRNAPGSTTGFGLLRADWSITPAYTRIATRPVVAPPVEPPVPGLPAGAVTSIASVMALDVTNTGCRVAAAQLTIVNGPYTTKANGEIIEKKKFTDTINVQHSGVVIRDCIITAGSYYGILHNPDTFPNASFTAEYCTVSKPDNGIAGGKNCLVYRCHIFDTSNAINFFGPLKAYNNYIPKMWSLTAHPGAHNDGVENNGNSGFDFSYNRVLCSVNDDTSALMFVSYFSNIAGGLIKGNYAEGGQYTVYADGTMRIEGNTFKKGRWGHFNIPAAQQANVTLVNNTLI